MLTYLSLTNFKSWERISEMRLAPITGLFGANSSGKTSILQLLLLLQQTADSSDRTQVLDLGDERSAVSFGSFEELIHGHNLENNLTCQLAWNLEEDLEIRDPNRKNAILFRGQELDFSTVIREDERRRMFVQKMSYGFAGSRFGMSRKSATRSKYKLECSAHDFRFTRTRGRPWDLPRPIKCYGFPDETRAYYQNAGFLSDFELEFEDLCDRIHYLGPLREYPKRDYVWSGAEPADMGERGEKVVDALLASRESGQRISRGRGRKSLTVEEYVATWLRDIGLIYQFSIEPLVAGGNHYRVLVKKTAASPSVPLPDVGFGVSQLLPVLTICYYVPEGSVVLLEQPEIHLHPSVQADLADILIDAVEKKAIQIILESHSEHLLRRLQRRIAEEKISKENVALYFCENTNQTSILTELDVDLYGNIVNWPKEFFADDFEEMAAMTEAMAKRKQRSA